MATATETKTKSVDEQLGDLRKEFTDFAGNVTKAVEQLNRPDVRMHAGKGTVGYWDPDSAQEVKTAVRSDGRFKTIPRGFDPSYKNEEFKSAGQYYHELIRQPAEWEKKCAAIKDRCKAIQGMSTQVGADGGSWVLPEFSNEIIDDVYSNPIWAGTDGYTLSGNNLTFKANAETSRANGSRHGGLRGYWRPEGGSLTASLPRTRDVSLKLNNLSVLVYLTNDLIEDAGPALGQYVSRKAAEEFEFMLGDAVFNGNGVGMPLGILNCPDLVSIAAESGQLAATIYAENIDKMWARRRVGGNYAFFHNQDCIPQLDQLSQSVGTGGVALYRPTEGIAGAAPQMLKTAPRVETEFNATLGTAGDIILAALGKYITISKGGVMQTASTHVQFLTDQLALKFTMRVDGRSAYVSPLTPFKGSNTQGYFLALATR